MTEIYSSDERTEDKTLPAVCYGLYLLAFATGITAIIGLVIAYAQRSSAGPTMHTHYTYLVRTFWGGLMFMLVGGVTMAIGAILSIILIGFPIMGLAWLILTAGSIWYAVRCIIGLVYLSRGEAHPRPYAVLA